MPSLAGPHGPLQPQGRRGCWLLVDAQGEGLETQAGRRQDDSTIDSINKIKQVIVDTQGPRITIARKQPGRHLDTYGWETVNSPH